MELSFKLGGQPLVLINESADGGLRAGVARKTLAIDSYSIGERFIRIRSGGRELRLLYHIVGGHVHVAHRGEAYEFVPAQLDDEATEAASGGFTPEVTSPMPGKVLDILVAVDQTVDADEPLLLLEAMKMEQTVRAAAAARIVEVRVEVGAMVGPGEVLLVLEDLAGDSSG
jgi:3-methylcrotonyl-CoA carboxylase alpha subunit